MSGPKLVGGALPATSGDDHGDRARPAVLIAVIALFVVSETALAPFYPALFRRLFDLHDLAATGTYLWVARIAGLAALPLWGLAARRWPLHRLIVAGLWAAAVLDLTLGFAPSWLAFTVLTAGVVAVQSVLLLAYPAYVTHVEQKAGDRLAAVRTYVFVAHAAMSASALLGAGVLLLPNPRVGISAFAVLDVTMALLCRRVLATPAGDARPPRTAPAPRRTRRTVGLALAVAALATLVELAANLGRPFFTEYAFAGGASVTGAAVLFLAPSAAVCATLPAVRMLARRLGPWLLPVGLGAAAAGLAVQATTPAVAVLLAGRTLFGAGLAVAHVGVDLRVFTVTGTAGPAFTAVETLRSLALLAIPVLATATAAAHLALPLATAAVVFAAAIPLALLTPATHPAGPTRPPDAVEPPRPVPPTEEDPRAPVPHP